MSYVDVLSRISQIEQQIAQLQSPATTTAAATPGTTGAASSSTGTSSTSSTAAATFANALAEAQGAGGSSIPGASAIDGGAAVPSSTATLPAGSRTMLTSDQQQFASRLASDTGLDPGVVSAWLLAEESGGAAESRQAANNNDWLNIGYTGSGTFGASDSIWADPTTAADATAGWMKGENTIPGYGTASAGIQGILTTASQAPAAQISALQTSGWAGSGYTDLPALYAQVAG